MGILARLATGWKLMRYSFGVLFQSPRLMVFPLISGIGTAIFGGLVFLILFTGDFTTNGIEYVFVFALYFGTTLITTYFNTALVFAVNDRFHGRRSAPWRALAAAWKRKRLIVIWSVVVATIGVVLARVDELESSSAESTTMVFDIAWTVITFFVVPVIAFEGGSVTETFAESADTFRKTWGESIASGFGIDFLTVLLGFLGIFGVYVVSGFVDVVLPVTSTVILLGGSAIVVLGVYLVGQTVRAITKTVLYLYATEEEIPEMFSEFDFETLEGRTERAATPGVVAPP